MQIPRWNNLKNQYTAWRSRRLQWKVAKAEAKAKQSRYKADAARYEGIARGQWVAKEVKIENRVQKPKKDSTEQEFLETYGTGVWVYAACNAIAEKLASVQPQLVDGDNEVQDADEILRRIQKPNPHLTQYGLFELTQLWRDLAGIAYWHVPKDEPGIFPLRPTRMAIVPGNGGVAGYAYKKKGFDRRITKSGFKSEMITRDDFEYTMAVHKGEEPVRTIKGINKNEWIPFDADEVIDFKYAHPYNDFYGMSPLQPLILSLETELYARSWNKRFFENGAVPLGIMIVPETIDPDEFKTLQEEWDKKHGGVKKSNKIGWLNHEIEFKEIELGPKDVEFLNLIRMTREDTLAVLNVPPVMVGIYEFANTTSRSAGVKEQRQIFWQDCIIPKLRGIYDSLNLHFYPEGDIKLAPGLTDIDALQPEWTEVAKGAKDAMFGGLAVEEVREIFWKKTGPPPGEIYLPSTITPTGDIEEDEERGTSYRLINLKKKLKAEVERTALWKSYIKQIMPLENNLFDWLKKLFGEQEKRTLANLDELWKLDAPVGVQKGREDILNLFDFNTEVGEFSEGARVKFIDLMSEHAQDILGDLGVSMTFNISDVRVQSALQNLSFTFADLVNRTTQEQLRITLSEAISEGEGIGKIKKRVQEVFKDTVRGEAPRARMIARTEIISVTNAGTKEAYRQSGVVKEKEWLSSRDNRVRETHAAADGQQVALDKAFSVGGTSLDYPGDPNAPPQERINCRCTMLAVLKE